MFRTGEFCRITSQHERYVQDRRVLKVALNTINQINHHYQKQKFSFYIIYWNKQKLKWQEYCNELFNRYSCFFNIQIYLIHLTKLNKTWKEWCMDGFMPSTEALPSIKDGHCYCKYRYIFASNLARRVLCWSSQKNLSDRHSHLQDMAAIAKYRNFFKLPLLFILIGMR